MAAATFWLGLSKDTDLYRSLTNRTLVDMKDLMSRRNKYAKVEDESAIPEPKAPALKKRDKEPLVRRVTPTPAPNCMSFQEVRTAF